jgi:c-di-GMP-related signal transduction protein
MKENQIDKDVKKIVFSFLKNVSKELFFETTVKNLFDEGDDNFDTNEKTKDILDCIIQLANRLGMKTLTEGVETEAESTFLENIGCGRLQGYLFGKPFVLRDFEDNIEAKEFTISKDII